MLTRLKFRKDFRVIARCLADKPSDYDGKTPEPSEKVIEPKKKSESSTEKIQELLKLMMSEPKFKESEYKDKFATAPNIPKRRKQKDELEVKTEKIEESITKAAGEVAKAIGGDVKQNEAELLSRVLGKINQSSTNLSDLLIGMKVDRTKEGGDRPKLDQTRGQQVKRIVKSKQEANQTRYIQRKDKQAEATSKQDFKKTSSTERAPVLTTVDIFSGQPLGIFKKQEPNYGTKLDVWENLKQRELTLATSQPPANYFQKMILWTEEGKVWKFPIDNEQGLESEKDVHFSEHIFLDAHLEGWCPKKGPIRHFMELVCVGLSKNPFYTVQEKKDHIMWYKEYFESKKNLLTEVGAWDVKSTSSQPTQSFFYPVSEFGTERNQRHFQYLRLGIPRGMDIEIYLSAVICLESEKDVHFSEHIFLDAHLEGWCPKKGPIRHFMELVCVGLSKNPFYTVQEKKDHIMWYKEYFESKKNLLTEVGAWDVKSTSSQPTQS